tara:strand:- start:98 stop:427 length:330 start_codon:yes stop_codon:yes gene_type:complete
MIDKMIAVESLVGGALSIQGGGTIIYHDGQTPPSESAINAKLAELQAAYPLQELREKRNVLLASSDWWASSDLVMSDERKAYRQALRDLPSGLDTEEKIKNVTWPTNPG